jgi:hypothetical protein
VPQGQVPDRRWLGYDPERRMRVRCFRLDLQGPASASDSAHAAGE